MDKEKEAICKQDIDYLSTNRATIQIIGAPHLTGKRSGNAPILDKFEASQEDSFSLETFQKLIIESFLEGKDFILVRILTSDPKDRSKTYASYYPAYPLNKVIFRTDPARGMLHRMRAKNPLNNMPIVGDVYYYTVLAKDIEISLKARFPSDKRSNIESTIHYNGIRSDENLHKNSPFAANPHTKHRRASSESNTVGLKTYYKPNQSCSQRISANHILFNAKFFATDDDFLEKIEVRNYFKHNAVQPDDFALYNLSENLASNSIPAEEVAPQIRLGNYQNLWNAYRNEILKSKTQAVIFHIGVALIIGIGIVLFKFLPIESGLLFFALAAVSIFVVMLSLMMFVENRRASNARRANIISLSVEDNGNAENV